VQFVSCSSIEVQMIRGWMISPSALSNRTYGRLGGSAHSIPLRHDNMPELCQGGTLAIVDFGVLAIVVLPGR
jgi:hypothetical protein